MADEVAVALRDTDEQAEHERRDGKHRFELRRRAALGEWDRGYDDCVGGRITEDFWTREG